jgi:hypothetical protein
MRKTGHPFALFYSRVRQMHLVTSMGTDRRAVIASTRWDHSQADVRPNAPALAHPLHSLQTPTRPQQSYQYPKDWENDLPYSSPSELQQNRRHPPPGHAFATSAPVALPPMSKLLETDEAYTWVLLESFLSAMLTVLHQQGWSTLFHADDASAQFSFDFQ